MEGRPFRGFSAFPRDFVGKDCAPDLPADDGDKAGAKEWGVRGEGNFHSAQP